MRLAKRRNSHRAGFEKCPISWKELIYTMIDQQYSELFKTVTKIIQYGHSAQNNFVFLQKSYMHANISHESHMINSIKMRVMIFITFVIF